MVRLAGDAGDKACQGCCFLGVGLKGYWERRRLGMCKHIYSLSSKDDEKCPGQNAILTGPFCS